MHYAKQLLALVHSAAAGDLQADPVAALTARDNEGLGDRALPLAERDHAQPLKDVEIPRQVLQVERRVRACA